MRFKSSVQLPDARRVVALSIRPTNRRWLEVLFWLVAFGVAVLGVQDFNLLLAEICILSLFALSLDLLLGYAGIVSLGHAAFFGFGAYAAGLLALHGIVTEPVLALIAAGLLTGVFGFVASFLVLRGTDLTKIMVTLGIALMLRELANKMGWLTGGADGLTGIVMEPVLGRFAFDIFGHTAFVYCLSTLFVLFLIARRVLSSPYGSSVEAIRENPLRSSAIGISVNRRLVPMFTLSAMYAGIAGGLLAQTTSFVSLSALDFERSADVLLMLIIGGTGYLYGGIVGALIFKVLHEWLSVLTPQYWQFWIGLVLVAVVIIQGQSAVRPLRHFLQTLKRFASKASWAGRHVADAKKRAGET